MEPARELRPPKFITPGREKLIGLGLGPSEISRRLGIYGGRKVNPSLVSRWMSGDSRPDQLYRPGLDALAGEPLDWMTEEEREEVRAAVENIEPVDRGNGEDN